MIRLDRLVILGNLELIGTALDDLAKPFLGVARSFGRALHVFHIAIDVPRQNRCGEVLPASKHGVACRHGIIRQEGIHEGGVGCRKSGGGLLDDRLHFQERRFLFGLRLLDIWENAGPAVIGDVRNQVCHPPGGVPRKLLVIAACVGLWKCADGEE